MPYLYSNSCHFRLCDIIFSLRGWVPLLLYFVRVMHFISCHHVHCIRIHVRLMHPSIFPVVRFAIRRSYVLRRPLLHFLHVRVSNLLGMDRGFTCGLGLLPVDRLSSFVSFGLRLVLQRLAEGPNKPRVCCSPKPLHNSPITHLRHFHVLRRSITIPWPKTALHLELPSSLYLYKGLPLLHFGSNTPKP